jgi:hypothetical protein
MQRGTGLVKTISPMELNRMMSILGADFKNSILAQI